MSLSKEHVMRHMAEMHKGWMRSGSTGLTTNCYALALQITPERAEKYLREMGHEPAFCSATQAWVWPKDSGGPGYNDAGDPFDADEIKEGVKAQNKLGPCVVDNGVHHPLKGPRKKKNRIIGRGTRYAYTFKDWEPDHVGDVFNQIGVLYPMVKLTEKRCLHCMYQIPYGLSYDY